MSATTESDGKSAKRRLVIVESPAKAKTIGGYLGKNYVVESSIGHIRDLPRRASDIPPAYKKEAWARLGVDVDNNFKPLYVIDPDKKAHISKLKEYLKNADELYLATDEDREGESIAWHLLEVLNPKVPVKRMVFHEITRSAIEKAIQEPREVDRRLVDAQEARRILDRLYGYEVSPVLWKKVMPRLSAGRVQSVATRIIVGRETARIAFRAAQYWSLEATLTKQTPPDDDAKAFGTEVSANLHSIDGTRVASGKDFDDQGKLTKKDVQPLGEPEVMALAAGLAKAAFSVKSVETKPSKRSPSPPFMTSTLQQEAGRKLRYSSSRTMKIAQSLYERGYITYMRTDSTTLSTSALDSARSQIQRLYGANYLPERPRVYSKKVKNAQEAHEAIRPAGDVFRTPEDVAKEVAIDEAKLYELIWMRTIASQMQDARIESVQVRAVATTSDGKVCEFSASGNTITFPGFLRAYVEGSDDPAAQLENRERPLPKLSQGEALNGEALNPRSHETQPPARFTEASLVRQLEELGVGRPSTYASIISTILDRGYVWKKGAALIPSFKAFAVIKLLENHFGELVDYAFTARMEDELDLIAQGSAALVPWLTRFYFGDGKSNGESPKTNGTSQLSQGLRSLVADQLGEIDARAINSLPVGVDPEGREVIVRVGRFGPYLQRGEDTVSIPEELPPDEVTLEKSIEMLAAPSGDRELGPDPETGLTVYVRQGRYGAYVQLGEAAAPPKGATKAAKEKSKPKTASLMKSMTPENMTLEDGLKLLALPRVVGVDPGDEKEITAQLGRYGPYIQKGTDSRSLDDEDQIFTITVPQALEVFAKPRTRMRRQAAAPLKELGKDEISGGEIVLKEGRFGLYVTDGETNASLRRGDTQEGIDNARAQELLQERRQRGPAPGKAKKKTSKKATAKKTTTKKAAADAPAPKKPAKKTSKKKTSAKKTSKKKTTTKKTAPES